GLKVNNLKALTSTLKPTANYTNHTPQPTVINTGDVAPTSRGANDELVISRTRGTEISPVGGYPDDRPGPSRNRPQGAEIREPGSRSGAPGEPTGELGAPLEQPGTNVPTPLPSQANANPAYRVGAVRPTQRPPPHPGVKTTRAVLKIASLNIRGGGSATTRHKWQHVNQLLRQEKLGLLAIHEAHLKDEDIDALHQQFPTRLHIINNTDPENPTSKGVAVIINKSLTAWKDVQYTCITPGRASLVKIPWTGGAHLRVLAVYAPNDTASNAAFWDSLRDDFDSGRHPRPDIVLGDFNMVEEAIDRLPAHRDAPLAVQALAKLKESLNLRDGWREDNPEELAYSYLQTYTKSRSRIDRIYVKDNLLRGCRNWTIKPTNIKTDHQMVTVECANAKAPYIGKGRWSIPPRALEDRKIKKMIKECGLKLQDELDSIPEDESWETGRSVQRLFKNFKDEITKKIRTKMKEDTPKLEARLEKLKNDIRDVLNNENLPIEEKQLVAEALEAERDNIEAKRHQKIRDSVSDRFWLQGETLSKYWINLNKSKTPRDTITRLRTGTGVQRAYTTNSKQMAEEARSYHESLQMAGLCDNLTEDETDEVLSHLTPRLSNHHKHRLAEYLDEEEVRQAMKDLPNGKAPGMDGIPNELWKILDDKYHMDHKHRNPAFNIVQVLTRVFNDIERHGIDPDTNFAKGWMCPIYKKGDEADIANYRPITVLNTDYKMMTRALTTKLSEAVPTLIHPDQAGFMKGRRIEDQTDLAQMLLYQKKHMTRSDMTSYGARWRP
ncbi:hypothetical protein CVT26_002410, partial [Gymnopilus dilepis]